MMEVPVRFQDGEIVFDTDDPNALLRDAKRYRRTGKQMQRRLRSGKFGKKIPVVQRPFEDMAEACERRAEQLVQASKNASG
jgi:hypothetical protein